MVGRYSALPPVANNALAWLQLQQQQLRLFFGAMRRFPFDCCRKTGGSSFSDRDTFPPRVGAAFQFVDRCLDGLKAGVHLRHLHFIA